MKTSLSAKTPIGYNHTRYQHNYYRPVQVQLTTKLKALNTKHSMDQQAIEAAVGHGIE